MPRARRWFLIAVIALTGLVAVSLLLVLGLLSSLDGPWCKDRIRRAVREQVGADIDYGTLRLYGLAELALTDVVVRTPEPLRGAAPELLRVASIRVRTDLSGDGPVVRDLEIEGVALTVVQDEHGRTSFDALLTGGAAKEPPLPLSKRVSELFAMELPLQRVRVRNVSLALVRSENGRAVARDQLQGLALDAELQPGRHGLRLALGTPESPLPLSFTRQGLDGAHAVGAKLWLEVTGAGSGPAAEVRVALGLDSTHQDYVADLPQMKVARLDAHARFDSSRGQSTVSLSRLTLGSGAAQARAELLLPDRGEPLLQQAAFDVDVKQLLALAPKWLVPGRAQGGELHGRVEELQLGAAALAKSVNLEGQVSGIELSTSDATVALDSIELSLAAQPSSADLSAKADLRLRGLRLTQSGLGLVRGDDLTVRAVGVRQASGHVSGEVALEVATLTLDGERPLSIQGTALTLKAKDLLLQPDAPLLSRGDLLLSGAIDELVLGGPDPLAARDLTLSFHLPLAGGFPLTLEAALDSARVRLKNKRGKLLLDRPLHLALSGSRLVPDLEQPEHSTGAARTELSVGRIEARLEAVRQTDTLDADLRFSAPELSALTPFLPPDLVRLVQLRKLGVTVHSDAQVTGLSGSRPTLRQHTELSLTGLSAGSVLAKKLSLELSSQGTSQRQQLTAELRGEGLKVEGTKLPDDRLTLTLGLDLERPNLKLRSRNEGAFSGELDIDLAFDRRARVLSYEIRGAASNLGKLSPLLASQPQLAGLELAKPALSVSSQGKLSGLVQSITRHGALTLAPDPLHGAAGQAVVDLALERVRWADSTRALSTPALHLHATCERQGSKSVLKSELSAEQLTFALGARRLALEGLRDLISVVWNDGPDYGTVDYEQTTTLRELEQRFVPSYTVGDLTANIKLQRSPDGMLHLEDLRLENRAGGTSLSLEGGVDLGADPQRFSVRIKLRQDLARLSSRKDLFVGSGTAQVRLALRSPDFRVFRARARVELDDVSVALPGAELRLTGVNGEVPIESEFVADQTGIELIRGVEINPYTLQRFADQHPLLSDRSFVSIKKISSRYIDVAPFAANLRIEQSFLSLSQLEMGVRGGTITGSSLFFWNGEDSRLEANVRATGVHSSHGEPFDGNASLVLNLADRSVEGRADILRIGRRHLLDLLDLQDPLRADPGLNRIRSALRIGYPERVRLSFKHGFASAGVTLGGAARLVKIGDIRGIPIGPLMESIEATLDPESSQ